MRRVGFFVETEEVMTITGERTCGGTTPRL
jgi:hypothetical protein